MTKQEEKILICSSLVFLFIMIILSIISWKEKTQIKEEAPQKSRIFTVSYVFQKEDGITEGNVEYANTSHADCFVKLISKENSLETKQEDEDLNQENDSIRAVIYYNNEFFLPDYDSFDFAGDVSERFSQYFVTQDVTIAESSDEELKKAMQPAIIIESNLPMEEMQKFISESLENIFTEENDKP